MAVIRDASPADENRILDLWQQLHEHHDAVQPVQPSGWNRDPELTSTYIRDAWAEAPGCRILVAEVDGLIQGFVKFAEVSSFYNHAEIQIISVDKEHRGEGIGSQLMAAAMAYFASQGHPEVELGVVFGNNDAMRLYERLGFQPYLVRYVKKLG